MLFMDKRVNEANGIAEQTEKLIAELLTKRAGLFTAAELLWVGQFSAKLRWSISVETERKYYEVVLALKRRIQRRSRNGAATTRNISRGD